MRPGLGCDRKPRQGTNGLKGQRRRTREGGVDLCRSRLRLRNCSLLSCWFFCLLVLLLVETGQAAQAGNVAQIGVNHQAAQLEDGGIGRCCQAGGGGQGPSLTPSLTAHNVRQGRKHKKLKLVSANVTSLCKHASDLRQIGCDVLLLQEPRFNAQQDKNRLRKDWGGQVYHHEQQQEVLAAIVVLQGNFEPVWLAGVPQSMTHRVYAGLWWPAGASPYLLVSVYGFADPTKGQLQDLSSTLQAVLEFSEARGGLKTLIGGDLNAELRQLPVEPWLTVAGWRDLQERVTCMGSRSQQPRRIDVLVASPAAARDALQCDVKWDTGIVTHAANVLHICTGPGLLHKELQRPQEYPAPVVEKADRRPMAAQIVADRRMYWYRAKNTRCVDTMWGEIQDAAHYIHTAWAGVPIEDGRQPVRTRWREDEPRRLHTGDVCTQALARIVRRKRRLQQILSLVNKRMHAEARQVWDSVTRDEQDGWSFLCGAMPSADRLQQLIKQAKEEVDSAVLLAREEKREQWHAWAAGSMAKGGAAVFSLYQARAS